MNTELLYFQQVIDRLLEMKLEKGI